MSLLGQILGTVSGGKDMKVSEQLLFDKVIGYRGVIDGVGCSTLVFNTACALSDITNMNICVVDTHIVNPVLATYLGGKAENGGKDWFDFDGNNISDIAYATRFQNVYLVSLYNRGLPEMLSNYDNEKIVLNLFDNLTKFFDIVLVDLSHEPTFISSVSAVRCNKIYTIFEPSLGCMANLKSSINTLVELGIPAYKLSKVIVNKNIGDVNAGYQKVLNQYNFKLIANIPFSVDIARNNVIGQKIWGMPSNKAAITQFNQAMDMILDDVLQSNTQAVGYLKDETERGEYEDKNMAPKRVDGEQFDYVEPTGKVYQTKKTRPQGVTPRGVNKPSVPVEMGNTYSQATVNQAFAPNMQAVPENNQFAPNMQAAPDVQTNNQFAPSQSIGQVTHNNGVQVNNQFAPITGVQDNSQFAPANGVQNDMFTPVQNQNSGNMSFAPTDNANMFSPINNTNGGNKNA